MIYRGRSRNRTSKSVNQFAIAATLIMYRSAINIFKIYSASFEYRINLIILSKNKIHTEEYFEEHGLNNEASDRSFLASLRLYIHNVNEFLTSGETT